MHRRSAGFWRVRYCRHARAIENQGFYGSDWQRELYVEGLAHFTGRHHQFVRFSVRT
jgi:hypothetical protein